MNPELAYYAVRYYSNLMTDVEHLADRHLTSTIKAMHGRDDADAQREAMRHHRFIRFVSQDPEVVGLAKEGMRAFRARTAARILEMHGDQVFLNRCPRCNELARTPKAKQCRACGFDWHS